MADKTIQEIQDAKRTMPNGVVFSHTRIESLQEVVQFIGGVLLDFPSISSLCLEQAEEIKRLRGALRDAKESACGNDDCDCCMSSYNIAFQALSPQSK